MNTPPTWTTPAVATGSVLPYPDLTHSLSSPRAKQHTYTKNRVRDVFLLEEAWLATRLTRTIRVNADVGTSMSTITTLKVSQTMTRNLDHIPVVGISGILH